MPCSGKAEGQRDNDSTIYFDDISCSIKKLGYLSFLAFSPCLTTETDMASLSRIAAYSAAALLFALAASGLHVPTSLEYSHFTRRQLNITQAQQELGSRLSPS